ncbi:hypothetical protein A9495_08290 [Brachyspira hampsonii]|nr:hypothetical protein [Brachyspira hampsonii]MBW5396071.1 hypothetical protein [Brachyspira hampsonii]OEJ17178.1 hypothetical protein A9495_08290 [Brachyspira hampsonii]
MRSFYDKKIKLLLTLSIFLTLASCAKNNPSSPGDGGSTSIPGSDHSSFIILKGQWMESQGDMGEYDITDTSIEHRYQSALAETSDLAEIAWNDDGKSGIIYGKYITTLDSKNGKYYALAFRNLTDTTVDFVQADKSGDDTADSLEEAKTKFTEANGYIDWNNVKTYNKGQYH